MRIEIRSAIDFYERHPISSEIILAKLNASRGHLNDIAPDELFPHDQDHYGGLDANDVLAERASVGKGTLVVDFCAGLGGPARYLAHRYGADVTGIELTPARVKGAEDLTRRVGLQNSVRVIEGNVLQVPLPDASVDVVISQEALLHVPDKERALAMAVADLYCLQTYAELIRRAGFTVYSIEDLTEDWGVILEQRLAMYRKLRVEAQEANTPAGHDAFYESYVRFVDLVNEAILGGGRFAGEKPR